MCCFSNALMNIYKYCSVSLLDLQPENTGNVLCSITKKTEKKLKKCLFQLKSRPEYYRGSIGSPGQRNK